MYIDQNLQLWTTTKLTATPSRSIPWKSTKLTCQNFLYTLSHAKYGSSNVSEIDSNQVVTKLVCSPAISSTRYVKARSHLNTQSTTSAMMTRPGWAISPHEPSRHKCTSINIVACFPYSLSNKLGFVPVASTIAGSLCFSF